MPNQRPAYQAVIPADVEHGIERQDIGAAWHTSKENILSVHLTQPATSFILVVSSVRKPRAEQPAPRPAA